MCRPRGATGALIGQSGRMRSAHPQQTRASGIVEKMHQITRTRGQFPPNTLQISVGFGLTHITSYALIHNCIGCETSSNCVVAVFYITFYTAVVADLFFFCYGLKAKSKKKKKEKRHDSQKLLNLPFFEKQAPYYRIY